MLRSSCTVGAKISSSLLAYFNHMVWVHEYSGIDPCNWLECFFLFTRSSLLGVGVTVGVCGAQLESY